MREIKQTVADTRGIRELAEQRMRELLFHAQSVSGTVPRVFSESELTETLAAFAESIVEQCCGGMCARCTEDDMLPAKLSTEGEFKGFWVHEREDSPGSFYKCFAWPIRSRWQRGE